MTRTLSILTILFSVGLLNCSRKPVYACGLTYLASRPKIDSKVLRLERVAIADTTIAFISGTVYGKDSSDVHVTTDTLMAANVYVVDQLTGKIYGKPTDHSGKYQFHLPASTYDLKVQYIAYNTLVIRNVKFGTGDIVEFDALLGQSGAGQDSSVYAMQADKTINLISQPTKTKKK
jgi:hypothetical protein